VIGNATSNGRVSITGIGANAPERVMKNDELAQIVDTSDEWIVERTGIRERRVAAPEQALSDLARPAAEAALEQAGLQASAVDLIVVATVTPDMFFPSTGASGLVDHALVVGGDVLSKIVDWQDRSTCVLFGDGAGAVVLERVREGGFLGFELGADGSGGPQLYMPAGGSRAPATAETVAERQHFAKMNGREVFKFATRVLVDSAEKVLEECGVPVEEVDVYVPHQANVRIIDHARKKLGIPEERTVVNVDRFGNTSSGSIPLALGDAEDDGRLKEGEMVLMTGMGAGLTWGSALIEWTANGKGGQR
jgi:3-oxoacyl-[acyl-carrier-protein] synthase-3